MTYRFKCPTASAIVPMGTFNTLIIEYASPQIVKTSVYSGMCVSHTANIGSMHSMMGRHRNHSTNNAYLELRKLSSNIYFKSLDAYDFIICGRTAV